MDAKVYWYPKDCEAIVRSECGTPKIGLRGVCDIGTLKLALAVDGRYMLGDDEHNREGGKDRWHADGVGGASGGRVWWIRLVSTKEREDLVDELALEVCPKGVRTQSDHDSVLRAADEEMSRNRR